MKGKKYVLPLLTATLLCSLVACSEAEEEYTYVVPTPGPNSGASQSGTYNASGTPTSQSSGSTTGSTSSSTSSSSGSTSGLANFSAASAKTEVLRHAGYTESMILGYESIEEVVGGSVQHNISFWMGIIHYTYVVSGVDGTIITFNTEFDNNGYKPSAETEETEVDPDVFVVKEGHVTKDQAKAIAAKDAGVSTSSMVGFVIKNRTTGNISEYEMTFKVGETEYYYTILPTTGIITLARKTEPEPEPEPEIQVPEVVVPSVSTGGSSGSSSSSSGSSSSGATTTTPTTPVIPETSVPEVTEPEVPTTEIPDSAVQSSSSSSSVVEEVTGTQSSTASSSATSTATSSSTSTSEVTSESEISPSMPPMISSNQAKNLALTQAGVSESDISSLSVLEANDSTGAVVAYNVSFISGGTSHYYSVSATTGVVR